MPYIEWPEKDRGESFPTLIGPRRAEERVATIISGLYRVPG